MKLCSFKSQQRDKPTAKACANIAKSVTCQYTLPNVVSCGIIVFIVCVLFMKMKLQFCKSKKSLQVQLTVLHLFLSFLPSQSLECLQAVLVCVRGWQRGGIVSGIRGESVLQHEDNSPVWATTALTNTLQLHHQRCTYGATIVPVLLCVSVCISKCWLEWGNSEQPCTRPFPGF